MKKIFLFIILAPCLLFAQYYGSSIVVRDSVSFAHYIDYANNHLSDEINLAIVDSVRYAVNDTVPDNVYLSINRNGCLYGLSADTLYINGSFDAPLRKCFDSTIIIKFDTSSVKMAYPEWWGLSTDSTDQNALNAMWQAFPAGRKPEMKLTGSYYTNDTWYLRASFLDSSGYNANEKGTNRDHIHIIGYGASIFSVADTVLKIELGYIDQSEPNNMIEGLRIFGDGFQKANEPVDWDAGTNIGIYIRDTSGLKVFNCTLRNLDEAIIMAHHGPGLTPRCNELYMMWNHIVSCSEGIVFKDEDPTVSFTAEFEQCRIAFNRFTTHNSGGDTLNACISINEDTRLSRSQIVYNEFYIVDSSNVFYINGGIAGCVIDLSCEGNNSIVGQGGAVFRIGNDFEDPTQYVGSDYIPGFDITLRHVYGINNIVKNYSGKRFPYVHLTLAERIIGFTPMDWTGNVRYNSLEPICATGGWGFYNPDLMYLFQGKSGDTVITDLSDNFIDLILHGATQTENTITGWQMRSFNGTSDYAVTYDSVVISGNRTLICGFIPGVAYNSTEERLFKFFSTTSNLIQLNHCTGWGTTSLDIFADNGVSTDSITLEIVKPFAAGDPLVVAVTLDTINDKASIWYNGIKYGTVEYVGNITNSKGQLYFASDVGGGANADVEIGFFCSLPYVDEETIKKISAHVLNVLGNENVISFEEYQFKGNDIASASTITLNGGTSFDITGITQIDSINVNSPQESGTVIYLQFDASVIIADGHNLILAGNFSATTNDILILIRRDNYFYEISRSAN